jgi:hexosaminidase
MLTEYIKDRKTIEVMILPRLAAMAEVQWATDRRDAERIREKMEVMRKFYDSCGWNYAPYYFEGRE